MQYDLSTIKVGVLKGGISNEKEISHKTGDAVLSSLSRMNINAVPIDVDIDIVRKIFDYNIDLAFIALHGLYGEDGRIQAVLDMIGIPYTSTGIKGSAIAIDKAMTKDICKVLDIPTPEFRVIRKNDDSVNIYIDKTDLPVVVKPNNGGSSIGVSIARTESELRDSLSLAFSEDDEILIEKYIDGRLITVSILNDRVLPLIEIATDTGFYDHEHKYTVGRTIYNVPANIPDEISAKVSAMVLRLHKYLDCRGATRSEVMLDKYENPYFIELNTIPGMTNTSLLPKAALAAGIDYDQLVKEIVLDALKR